MSKRYARIAAVVILAALMLIASASAAQALSAGVVMTVSRTTQDSVINEGENLTIDVQIEGVTPVMYRWYFEGGLIEGAAGKVYSISAATEADAGMYRVEAFSEDGKMLVTMEFSVRVIGKALPQAGDSTLGIGAIAAMMTLSAAACAGLVIRRRLAA